MWFKKEDTLEPLTKDCNELYSDFKSTITLAHTKGYFKFKEIMDGNFHILRDIASETNLEEARLNLLKSFKEQLEFFNKYPFSSEPKALDDFANKFFPYKEKMLELTKVKQSESLSNKKKI